MGEITQVHHFCKRFLSKRFLMYTQFSSHLPVSWYAGGAQYSNKPNDLCILSDFAEKIIYICSVFMSYKIVVFDLMTSASALVGFMTPDVNLSLLSKLLNYCLIRFYGSFSFDHVTSLTTLPKRRKESNYKTAEREQTCLSLRLKMLLLYAWDPMSMSMTPTFSQRRH